MTSLLAILRAYPLLSALLIFGPLLGGIVGAYLGYDNLNGRHQKARQEQRYEARQEALKEQVNNLSVPAETLRRYEATVESQGAHFDVLRRLLAQYDALKTAIEHREQFIGADDARERIATAEHVLGEVRALLGTARTIPAAGGQALIIGTAHNTFRVIFSVPMRIAPALTFHGLPDGVIAHELEKSNLGFAVVFTPANIDVEKFDFEASAEL